MKMSAHSVVRLALCALLVTIHLVTPKVVAADDYYGCNINSGNGRGAECSAGSCDAADSMVCGYKWCTPATDGCTLQGYCGDACDPLEGEG